MTEREAFEKWAKPFFFSLLRAHRDTEEYDNLVTQAAWMAWEARAALGVSASLDGTPNPKTSACGDGAAE